MLEMVKNKIAEAIEVAESVPEKYQQKCFEVLLETALHGNTFNGDVAQVAQKSTGQPLAGTQFLAAQGITDNMLSRVLHLDGDSYELIASNLKVGSVAQKEVRLALLLGVKNLLEGGEGFFQKDSLVTQCKKYAAFDSPNFAAHMKKQRNLFLAKENGWVLTVPGKEQAAQAIKELAE